MPQLFLNNFKIPYSSRKLSEFFKISMRFVQVTLFCSVLHKSKKILLRFFVFYEYSWSSGIFMILNEVLGSSLSLFEVRSLKKTASKFTKLKQRSLKVLKVCWTFPLFLLFYEILWYGFCYAVLVMRFPVIYVPLTKKKFSKHLSTLHPTSKTFPTFSQSSMNR